jgi:hypothetical protein
LLQAQVLFPQTVPGLRQLPPPFPFRSSDGVAAQHPYGVLAEAMQQAGQGALGRVVLSSLTLRLPRTWERSLWSKPAGWT